VPLSTSDAARLVDAQAAMRDRVNRQVVARIEGRVRSFGGWWSDSEVEALARQVVMVVEAGQSQTARLTDAYLSRLISQAIGKPLSPVGVPVEPEVWRRADHVAAYMRPAADVRRKVAAGQAADAAISAAVSRVGAMVETDLSLAMTHTSRAVYGARSDYIDGYRRVIRPERSRSGSCGLCAAASDQVYGSGDLMPIHDRCRCETLPIVNGEDPGQSLNGDELRSLYDAAGSTKGSDLKRVRVKVREHGELGPVLTDASHNWRGPTQVAAAA
jgi:hypothetical protein